MSATLNNRKGQPDNGTSGADWEHLINLLKILTILFILFSSFHWIIIKRAQHLPVANTLPLSSSNQSTSPETKMYRVIEGDTLWKIAIKQYPNRNPQEMINEIKKVNQLTSDTLKAGQSLRLP